MATDERDTTGQANAPGGVPLKKIALVMKARGAAAIDLLNVLELINTTVASSFERTLANVGLTAHEVWTTQEDDVTTFFIRAEGDDVFKALQLFYESGNPVAKWIRENIESKSEFRYDAPTALELRHQWRL